MPTLPSVLNVELDAEKGVLRWGEGQELRLRPAEARILDVLLREASGEGTGRPGGAGISAKTLAERARVEPSAVPKHVSLLRGRIFQAGLDIPKHQPLYRVERMSAPGVAPEISRSHARVLPDSLSDRPEPQPEADPDVGADPTVNPIKPGEAPGLAEGGAPASVEASPLDQSRTRRLWDRFAALNVLTFLMGALPPLVIDPRLSSNLSGMRSYPWAPWALALVAPLLYLVSVKAHRRVRGLRCAVLLYLLLMFSTAVVLPFYPPIPHLNVLFIPAEFGFYLAFGVAVEEEILSMSLLSPASPSNARHAGELGMKVGWAILISAVLLILYKIVVFHFEILAPLSAQKVSLVQDKVLAENYTYFAALEHFLYVCFAAPLPQMYKRFRAPTTAAD